jgi:hypothetical protein
VIRQAFANPNVAKAEVSIAIGRAAHVAFNATMLVSLATYPALTTRLATSTMAFRSYYLVRQRICIPRDVDALQVEHNP